MTHCLGTLEDLNQVENNGVYSHKFSQMMFGTKSLVTLPLTRKEFKRSAPEFVKGISISGVQQKLSLKLKGQLLVPTATGGEYILKPSPEEFDQCSENEHLLMQLSARCGMDTALNCLIPFADGEHAYLTKRFDLLKDGSKLFVEDLCQVAGLRPKDKYSDQHSYESSINLCKKVCGGKMIVALEMFKRVLFAYLVGNSDYHLKNISLIRKSRCQSTTFDGLSPAYDIISTAPYPAIDGEYLSLSLLHSEVDADFSEAYNTYGYYTLTDFKFLGKNCGLPAKVVVKTIEQILNAIEDITPALSGVSPMAPSLRGKIDQRIKERIRCLRTPFPGPDKVGN